MLQGLLRCTSLVLCAYGISLVTLYCLHHALSVDRRSAVARTVGSARALLLERTRERAEELADSEGNLERQAKRQERGLLPLRYCGLDQIGAGELTDAKPVITAHQRNTRGSP
jgi:hypothetical protein